MRLELERLRTRCAQLQARCSELEPDAMRYRALRDAALSARSNPPIDRFTVEGAVQNNILGSLQP